MEEIKQLNQEEYMEYIEKFKKDNKIDYELGKIRKVFLECLPRYEDGAYKGKLNWKESSENNYVIYFIFNGIEGEISIVDYITKTHQIIVNYNNTKNYKMNMQDFKYAKLFGLFNQYKYDESNPKRVDLRQLPNSSNGIQWDKLSGYKIPFYYDEICGEVMIVKYIKKTTDLIIEYNSKEFKIRVGNFRDGKLGEMLGKINHEYKYNVDDIVKTKTGEVKILKCFKKLDGKDHYYKCYQYLCSKCGNIDEIGQGDLIRERGCNVCCAPSQKVMIGYNDIATISPWLVEWLENKDDAYKYTSLSTQKINFKCKYCGSVKNMRICYFNPLTYQCKSCGDKISIGEKIMFNILEQLGINFEAEYSPDWAKPRRYDFYLNDYNIVTEMHGKQHYEESTGNRRKPIEQEQENDRIKKELALANGILQENYIVIDCRKSELEWIKNNIDGILNSRLSELFDLSTIDWDKVLISIMSNRTKEACDLWNSGIESAKKISEIMKINRNSATKYLKNGAKLGWTKYNPKTVIKHYKNTNGKSLICIETGAIFKSIQECVKTFKKEKNLKLVNGSVSSVCLGKRSHTKGYHFKYTSQLTQEQIKEIQENAKLNQAI